MPATPPNDPIRETPLDRALRDGGDERDALAPRADAIRRVREASRCTCDVHDPGDPENGPRLVIQPDVLCLDHGRRADPEFWASGDDPDPIVYLHDAWAEAMSEPPAPEPPPVERKWKVRVLHATPSSVTTETTTHLINVVTGEAACGTRLSSTARPASITDRRCPECMRRGGES